MLKTLALILPVLMPSWRFFQTIEPSPRVEWALRSASGKPVVWHEFRPRPLNITPLQMVLRLFWNPGRNEDLFVISCAERIQQQPTSHSIEEIRWRIQVDIARRGMDAPNQHLQFRLVFVHREQTQLVQRVMFISEVGPAKIC